MNKKNLTHERIRVIINRKFQIKMIVTFLLINALVLVLFGGIMDLFLNSEIDAQYNSAHTQFKSFHEMLSPIIITISVINFFVSGFFISFLILVATFRMAGPMFRFHEALKSVSERDLNPTVHIRKQDQFALCATTLERAVTNIRNDIRAIAHDVKAAKKLIEKKKMDPDITKRIISIQKRIAHYKY